MKNEVKELKNKNFSIDDYKKVVKEYMNFSKLTYFMVNELVDYIEIGEKNKETLEQEVVIHWNF